MDFDVNKNDYDDIIYFYKRFSVLEKKTQELKMLLETRKISLMHGNDDVGYGFFKPSEKGDKKFLTTTYQTKVFKTNVNGLNISKEMMASDTNPFQDQFNAWSSQNSNIEFRINDLTNRVTELSKYAFTDKFNDYEFNNLNEELRQLKVGYLDGQIIKTKADELNKISPENRNIIKKYYAIIDDIVIYANALNQLGNLINDCMAAYMPNKSNNDLDLNLIGDTNLLRKIEEYKLVLVGILSKYELYDNKDIKTASI